MQSKLNFISGLPRAGSTLLSALLRQNPRFHASMSSPMGSLVAALQREMSQGNEYGLFIDDAQRADIIQSTFAAYYRHIPAGDVMFDTNRLWTTKMPVLARLFPQAKVICCVRNVAMVIDSIESLIRRNCLQPSKIFNFEPGGTVYSRAEGLASNNGMVGFALHGLREAVFGEQADRLLLVRYESLTADPLNTLRQIYLFLDEPVFPHDPNNIQPCPAVEEFDARLGTPGLHSVGGVVHKNQRRSILPFDLYNRYEVFSFWLKKEEMPPGIRML